MTPLPRHVDVAIIGTGFAGIATAVELRRSGVEEFLMLERAHDVGGTWRDNVYPGCACDVPSHLYSFSFAPNPEWSSTFSPQPEIHAYLRGVVEREGLREKIHFGQELEAASWDHAAGRWLLQTSGGQLTSRVLIAAAGPLSEPSIPAIPGLRDFAGTVFHSASWDHDHELEGERVAVIGTGASAIQFVPQIQPHVAKLHVFQRTPPWIMPRPDRPLTPLERGVYRRLPAAQRLMRQAIYWGRESYAIPMLRVRLSRIIELAARRHLRRQVADPALRAKLTPDYAPGCKRILVSNDYLPAVGRANVELVCDPITEIRERSIVTAGGSERFVDTIILGTGFHVTDLPIADRISGLHGQTLAAHWDGSLHAHRGTTVAGFPNLFFLLGPNTGLGHTSVVLMAEAQARYVARALTHMRSRRLAVLDTREDVQRDWNAALQRRMHGTVWLNGGCKSWYLDRKGLNTTLWPDHTFRFFRAMRHFEPREYLLAPAREAAPVEVKT